MCQQCCHRIESGIYYIAIIIFLISDKMIDYFRKICVKIKLGEWFTLVKNSDTIKNHQS